MAIMRGHCLSGAASFEYEGPEIWLTHCRCESCRRNTSSPLTTWLGVPVTACHFTGAQPYVYGSSPGARRMFCHFCGTPMAFKIDRYRDETHFYTASLEHPEAFQPEYPAHEDEQMPWIKLSDVLPRHRRPSE